MRILYVDRPFYYVKNGANSRSAHIFQYLVRKYITNLVLVDPGTKNNSKYCDFGTFKIIPINSRHKKNPLTPDNNIEFNQSEIKKVIKHIKEFKYDVVFFRFYIYPQLMNVIRKECPNVEIIVDVDLLFSKLTKTIFQANPNIGNRYYLKEHMKLSLMEKSLFKNNYTFLFSNHNELKIVKCSKNFHYLQNVNNPAQESQSVNKKNILFYGDLSSSVNKEAFKNIVEHVYPQLETYLIETNQYIEIVGGGDSSYYQETIKRKKLLRIKMIGRVDDIHLKISQAKLVILPIENFSGTLTRAIETAQVGTPIVTTTIVAQSLQAEKYFFHSESFALMGKKCIQVINDERTENIVKTSKEYFNLHHSIDSLKNSLGEILLNLKVEEKIGEVA